MTRIKKNKGLVGWDKARNIAITMKLIGNKCAKEEILELYGDHEEVDIALSSDIKTKSKKKSYSSDKRKMN